MLKRRVIPLELLNAGRLVKTINFLDPRDVGDPVKSSRVYSDQEADELILLNISRNDRGVYDLKKFVEQIARECFVPIAVGGGISSLSDAEKLFEAGADKIVVNSVAYTNLKLISEFSARYGKQAVVVGIDVRKENGDYTLYSDCGRTRERISLINHVNKIVQAGAGELIIQSIDCDGGMQGYDVRLLETVLDITKVPIIAAGGAGNVSHLKQVFDVGVDAAACGSLFNFGDNNPLRTKAYLKNHGIPVKRV